MAKQEKEINLSVGTIAYSLDNPAILIGMDHKENRLYKINLDTDSVLLLKKYFRNSR